MAVFPCPRRRRKAERPAEILTAALAEFSEKGFAATRLEDVAARAGITKGTIYVYFPSKEELFVATLKERSQPVMDHLLTLSDDPARSALDILRRHLAFVAESMVEDSVGRDVFRILLAEGHRFPAVVRRWNEEVMEPAMEVISAVLRRGVERGEFRAGAADTFPQLVMAPIIMCNAWPVVAGPDAPLDVRRFVGGALDLFAFGLLERGAT